MIRIISNGLPYSRQDVETIDIFPDYINEHLAEVLVVVKSVRETTKKAIQEILVKISLVFVNDCLFPCLHV